MNQVRPRTQSKATKAASPSAPTASTTTKMEPSAIAPHQFQSRPPTRRITSARSCAPKKPPTRMIPAQPKKPIEYGLKALRFTAQGQLNGAVQPPKKRVAASAETMKTFTYSAK